MGFRLLSVVRLLTAFFCLRLKRTLCTLPRDVGHEVASVVLSKQKGDPSTLYSDWPLLM